jgi:geranylgeranyl pyrophosphate synthase
MTEGKFTFPLIHAVQTMNNDEVYEIVRRKPRDLETKQKCVKLLREIGSQEHCLSVLKALHRKLCEEAKKIGPNPYMEMALEHLMDF